MASKVIEERNVRAHAIVVLFCLCLGLRLSLFVLARPWTPDTERRVLVDDSARYDQLATTLIADQRFADGAGAAPDAFTTPLYPGFLSLIYAVFGHKPWLVLLAQIALDTLTCFVLLATLAPPFGARVALIASLGYALDPFLVIYALKLLSETLFIFLCVVAFYFFGHALRASSPGRALLHFGLTSACLGLATLTRPVAEYIPILLVAWLLARYARQPLIALSAVLVSLLSFGLTVCPWLLRNYDTFGAVAVSTSGASYNLLGLYITPMEVLKRHEDTFTVTRELFSKVDRLMEADGLQPQALNEFQRAPYARQLALRYILDDPLTFAKTFLLGLFRIFFTIGSIGFSALLGLQMTTLDLNTYTNVFELARAYLTSKGTFGWLLAGLIVPYFLVSYLATAVGLVIAWRRYDRRFLLYSLLMALYFVVIAAPTGDARFRLPAIPFALVFTGIGFTHWKQLWLALRLSCQKFLRWLLPMTRRDPP